MNYKMGYGYILSENSTTSRIPNRCKRCGSVKTILSNGLCIRCDKEIYG